MAQGYDEPIRNPLTGVGVRTLMLAAYDFPKHVYARSFNHNRRRSGSAARALEDLGALIWYSDQRGCGGGKRRIMQDISKLVEKWKQAVVGLATAHDKDAADRYESGIEECLGPVLTMPVRQIREFAVALLVALKSDPTVPFLVWRGYEVWVEMMKRAPDEGVKELKTALAREIVEMVESDAKDQLPEAMIRALQWRSPDKLEEVKAVVQEEKAAGRPIRLRGRESCLFLEAGGTESEPKVCVQV